MYLESIELCRFANHEKTRVVLPKRGVVIFHGANGSGKSMLTEAISWALFGRFIRTAQKWRPHPVVPGTSVRLRFSEPVLTVIRSNSTHGKVSLEVDPAPVDGVRVLNAYLQEMFGSFRSAMATTVFHRKTLNRFANGGDADRKAVIEEMLGIERIDEAYKEARAKLRQVESRVDVCQASVSEAEIALASARGRLEGLQVPEVFPLESVQRIARLEELLSVPLQKPQKIDWSSEREARRVYDEARCVQRAAERALVAAKRKEKIAPTACPKCGYVGPSTLKEDTARAIDELERAKSSVSHATTLLRIECRKTKEAEESISVESDTYESKRRANDVLSRELSNLQYSQNHCTTAASRYNVVRESYLEDIELKTENLQEKRSQRDHFEQLVARAQYMCSVFGPRGARLRMLGQAFGVISSVATRVIQATRGRGAVRVRANEKLTSIEILVDTGEGWTSYSGLSEGEQSATDFALLKALAAVPRHGRYRVPFVYDDVLDALDSSVRAGVARMVTVEGRENQVLILSHNERVRDLFPDAVACHVQKGVVHHGGEISAVTH